MGYSARSLCARSRVSAVPRKCDSRVSSRGGRVLAHRGDLHDSDDDVDIAEFGPKILRGGLELLPAVLARVAAGDPGDPQPTEGATWAGHFEDDDYVRVDWSQSARAIHNQVRACT